MWHLSCSSDVLSPFHSVHSYIRLRSFLKLLAKFNTDISTCTMQILFDEQGTYLTLGLQNYAYTGNRDLIAFKLSAMGLGLGPDWNRTGTRR